MPYMRRGACVRQEKIRKEAGEKHKVEGKDLSVL